MKRAIATVWFVLLLEFSVFAQQESVGRTGGVYFEVPREEVLLTILQPTHSPLKFEEVTCLFSVDTARTIIRYKVRNVSDKPITSFTVASWDVAGAGGTLPVVLTPKTGPALLPGQSMDSVRGEIKIIRSLDDKSRRVGQAKGLFTGKLRQIYFLIVDQVHFADGTSYTDQKFSQVLSDYLSSRVCDSEP